jgi:hypothetical protein
MVQRQPTPTAFLHHAHPLLAGGDGISLVVGELPLELAARGVGQRVVKAV